MSRAALLLALVAAVAGPLAAPGPAAARTKTDSPPKALWRSYPLAPQAKRSAAAAAQPPPAAAQPAPATPPDPRPRALTSPHSPKDATSPAAKKAAAPAKPRPKPHPRPAAKRQSTSYEISTAQGGFPKRLLIGVFLTALLLVVCGILVWARLEPLRHRRRWHLAHVMAEGPGHDLLEALRPKASLSRARMDFALAVHSPLVATLRRRLESATAWRPDAKRVAVAEPPREAPAAACGEIRLWRGFIRCHLYAVPEGADEPIAFSPYFRLREDDTSSPEALEALAALVAELEQAGWTVVADGPDWYQHRLERSS